MLFLLPLSLEDIKLIIDDSSLYRRASLIFLKQEIHIKVVESPLAFTPRLQTIFFLDIFIT